MNTIKFISSLVVAFVFSATVGALVLGIDWPWDGEGVIGFGFTLLLFAFGALPVLIVQRHRLDLSERPWLMGFLFGLAGYPLAYCAFAGFAELLRPLQLGQWFWPAGLICLSLAAISVSCWLAIRVLSSKSAERQKAPASSESTSLTP